MPDASTSEMFDVANYLYWANLSGLNLKFELTSEDLHNIYASTNHKIWYKFHASEEQTALPTYEVLQQLYEFSNVMQGQDWQDQPYFTEYFKGDVFPKFVLFSSHAEYIVPMLTAFGLESLNNAPPASAIFWDFYSLEDVDYVRVVFKPDSEAEVQLLTEGMTLQQFQSYVSDQIEAFSVGHPAGEGVEQWC